MIQLLATRYSKHIACTLGFIFYIGMVLPAYGMISSNETMVENYIHSNNYKEPARHSPIYDHEINKKEYNKNQPVAIAFPVKENKEPLKNTTILSPDKVDIDGPSQPEMSSF